jgi:peptide/nickel transport system permease protein
MEPGPNTLSLAKLRSHRSLADINWNLAVGGIIVAAVVLLALIAPLVAPHDPYVQDLSKRLLPPVWDVRGNWTHPLGIDALGRDYLSRLIYGSQVCLLIGVATVCISSVIGITLGVLAGYFKGRVDLVISFLLTVRLAMPAVLVALAVIALVGNSLTTVILVLGFILWDRFAVVTRSAVMRISTEEYIVAAKAIGCSTFRIVAKEILPNIVPSLIVVATLEVAHAVLLEASLSFLGLGVQPPTPSWGLMIAEGREQLFFAPSLIILPGLALFILILGVNLLGDGLRDLTASGERRE